MGKYKWSVVDVRPQDGHVLEVTFFDGTRGRFDMSPYLDKPIYRYLISRALFDSARVDCGTVVWNDELDIAPELLYEKCVRIDAVE